MVTDELLDFGDDWTPDEGRGPQRGSFELNGELVTWERIGDTLHYRTSAGDVELN